MSHFVTRLNVTKKSWHMSQYMLLQGLVGVIGKECIDQLKVV